MSDQNDQAKKALDCMATAATVLREAISMNLPVAPTQLMTVQIPGTLIDPSEFVWDPKTTPFTPLAVRVAEAKLVDNMVPVSKVMMGRSGKSVARSYLAALDYLVPIDSSISSAIASDPDQTLEPRLDRVRSRYNKAMTYLKAPDDQRPGQSRLTTYVDKQALWNQQVEQYAHAQERQLNIIKKEGKTVAEQRQEYLDWIQAHARDYKAAIQARYMDWVVHGYKFEIEFNFGIVDVSSGVKRIESSKEAFRNLTLIDADGASEYSGVNLRPRDWANHCQAAIEDWGRRNKGPFPLEMRAEIKRLRRLLVSHQALLATVEDGSYLPMVSAQSGPEADDKLKAAYVDVYHASDEVAKSKGTSQDAAAGNSPAPVANGDLKASENAKNDPAREKYDNSLAELRKKQNEWASSNLVSNQKANRENNEAVKTATTTYLNNRIKQITDEIKRLEDDLNVTTSVATMPAVLDADGKTIEESELKVDPSIQPEAANERPSPWTRIVCKVSQSASSKSSVTSDSASSFAAKASYGFFSASGGASHTSSSAKANSSMANLDVEISMDCMLVEVERPWLHAELFSDAELDCVPGFDLSPGPEALHRTVGSNNSVDAKYMQFCSYPTAFVVACNVDLEFSGDTSSLETAMESSTTEANLSVGYGPFALSASHKQSKSSSKSNAQSTATGMRISLQAPQIIAWVQELLPRLPKADGGRNIMAGFGLDPITV